MKKNANSMMPMARLVTIQATEVLEVLEVAVADTSIRALLTPKSYSAQFSAMHSNSKKEVVTSRACSVALDTNNNEANLNTMK